MVRRHDNEEEQARYEAEMGDDEQDYTTRSTERYIEDPPADLVIEDDPDPGDGRLGILRETREEYRRGDRRREEDAWEDRPAEVTAVRGPRGEPPEEDDFADDLHARTRPGGYSAEPG
ncbi:hypothetical protein [Actinomadura harenae]|uniref:DUF5709 domain-containing protein n=1 Tax=Actinomadura harenae TaxID=2483351 RepID=A0A3M2LVL8_9ACTN|nr:hypothetical protein [Actinomadura harenae]RMI41272.1 hypothetical protein EBO15_23600 [Actinomadura harenae]